MLKLGRQQGRVLNSQVQERKKRDNRKRSQGMQASDATIRVTSSSLQSEWRRRWRCGGDVTLEKDSPEAKGLGLVLYIP